LADHNAQMRITRYTHACVRLEHPGGGVLVIDPGDWTEPEASRGADAVLVTHWHPDHANREQLAAVEATVFGPDGTGPGDPVRLVAPGDQIEAAGFRVAVTGGKHATVHDGKPDLPNVGYIIDDGALYHPGDSFHLPGVPVAVLLVPVQGSWMRLSDALDFIEEVRPARSLAIHDGQLNTRGLSAVNDWLRRQSGYHYLAPGESLGGPSA
jgi:L-ascorbate metabolism protein UlaG (beta-lactamase superfamily)